MTRERAMEIGRIVRGLPPAAVEALRRWPSDRAHLGAVVDTRRNRVTGYNVGGRELPVRSARAMVRAGIAETWIVLWIKLTPLGEECRGYLRPGTNKVEGSFSTSLPVFRDSKGAP
jgi:hypothetical protein